MKQENITFIEGGFSLARRVWIETAPPLTKETIIEALNNLAAKRFDFSVLELHFVISHAGEAIDALLMDVLPEVYSLKTGYESAYPLISIYYPVRNLDRSIIHGINKNDRYRPGIHLYPVADETLVRESDSLGQLRSTAGMIVEKLMLCHEVALGTTAYFILREDPALWEKLLELRRLTYTYDTSLDMHPPLLQVAPGIVVSSPDLLLDPLSLYIKENENAVEIPGTQCGLTTLLIRVKENSQLPATVIPLGSCGVGQSEHKLQADGSITPCLFLSCREIPAGVWEECKRCVYVNRCTGCPAALLSSSSRGQCRFKKYLQWIEQHTEGIIKSTKATENRG